MPDQIKVLHVDDDGDIREITLLALETVGLMEVVQASSGAEALAKVQSFKPDVFLLDVMMPEMSGEELLARLRTNPDLDNTPCIFMTARVQSNEISGLIENGAIDVIQKPFDPMTLAHQIKEIIKK
ncbi:response regulator [Litoreibacter janthinus]|uniref:Response regulator receiver domain-containing protein n=1 Tax=Litoreibacter janthinus TaxID=670154 RepID=A0A1I6FRT6_9RHOB|nr:response regulator [Litoreibacter janthinus]SFR32670.1 Response regulator receiver domain-containing protein [Litoreibacter janthinus]